MTLSGTNVRTPTLDTLASNDYKLTGGEAVLIEDPIVGAESRREKVSIVGNNSETKWHRIVPKMRMRILADQGRSQVYVGL